MMFGLVLTALLGLAGGAMLVANAKDIAGRSHATMGWVHRMHALGWLMLGLILLGDGLRSVIGLFPEPSVPAYTTLVWLKVVLNAVAIAAFGSYILYAWTGRAWTAAVAAAIAVVHMLFWMFLTNRAMGTTIIVGDWAARMEFNTVGDIPGGPGLGAVMYFVPMLVIAFAFVAFWNRLPSAGQRFRHVMVAVALLVFLVTASVQANPDIDPDTPVLGVNMALTFAAAVVARMAFRPPLALQRRGVEAYPG